jgi:acetyltransferase-like isoleucine patch superfamily enzyme
MAISASSIHPAAEVAASAVVGEGTRIWSGALIREEASVGRDCVIGKGVYIDAGVQVGDRVKLENYVSLFRGTTLASRVFVGPHSCLLNDKAPRATRADGALKGLDDWVCSGVRVEEGASIGGGCTILPGVIVGAYALVGAGAVVTRNVPAHTIVVGNPSRIVGHVCECGARLSTDGRCSECGRSHHVDQSVARADEP